LTFDAGEAVQELLLGGGVTACLSPVHTVKGNIPPIGIFPQSGRLKTGFKMDLLRAGAEATVREAMSTAGAPTSEHAVTSVVLHVGKQYRASKKAVSRPRLGRSSDGRKLPSPPTPKQVERVLGV
jgi:hypothetical protein